MIADYYTESFTLNRAGDDDFWGDDTPTQVPVVGRWEQRRRLVRDANGEERVSEAKVFMSEPVTTNDTLTDPDGAEWPVIAVSKQNGLDGEFSHYEVSL